MKTPKTLLGFPIKEVSGPSLKDDCIKFGGPLMAGPRTKEVKFIGGPANDWVMILFEETTKLVLRAVDTPLLTEDVEYEIKQAENGEWVGGIK